MSFLALVASLPDRLRARAASSLRSLKGPLAASLSPSSSWPVAMSWTEPPPLAQDAGPEAVLTAFARMAADDALEHLQTHRGGLTDIEADARRAIGGPNILPTRRPPSWILTLLAAIPNPFNLLLIFLAIVQVSMPDRDWAAFTVLLVMVVASVSVRFWQEYRSSLAVFRLQSSVTNDVAVRRQLPPSALPDKLLDVRHVSGLGDGYGYGDGSAAATTTTNTVPEHDLVPGDLVLLAPGSVVPADCMILEASFLRISQSTWTGESDPVAKVAPTTSNKEATLFDLANVAFMGTSVVSGNGLALVLRTGAHVLIAGMGKELEKKRERNAFQKGIRNVSWMLIAFMCVMVPIVLGINGKTTGDWEQAILFSISVAVGLVPEMLPAIVNANLARGAFVLSGKKAIVKRLDSVQNLGAMSVLCSDKTGTLTKDDMTLCRHVDYAGADSISVLKLATVDATIQGINGNNMDAAIVAHRLPDGEPVSIAQYEMLAAIPFDFERRRSASIVRGATGQKLLIVKGAVDEVLALCTSVREGGVAVGLEATHRRVLQQQADALSRDGYRVLLVAEKQLASLDLTPGAIDDDDDDGLRQLESAMTLEGLLSFIDPPKEDAVESISRLRDLGVEVKVLTGDSLPVALNVCQALRLVDAAEAAGAGDDMQAMTGPELARLAEADDGSFDAAVATCRVFAKLTPQQKALVIGSLRDKGGHCVGMLGDGVNDCMALRRADVGISVDSGTSVAKDCADLILTEKGLSIIVDSVRIGRTTHGNTIKYIKMVASSNFGNVLSVLAASAWLPFQPMLSLQILAQNLLYDISQIAIPWDGVDAEYLQTPKRWNTLDLLRFVVVLGPTSSVIDMMTFCLGWFYYGVQTANNAEAVGMFQAHWFLQGLLTQTLIVHLLRTAKVPIFQSRSSVPLALSTGAIMAIGFAVPWIPPFQKALGFSQPAATYVGFLAAELVLYCIEVQLVKMVYMKVFGVWL